MAVKKKLAVKKKRAARSPAPRKLELARAVLAGLEKAYPDATCALEHANPLELLVATILSAQCTDARVNLVTPDLFKRYPTAAHYARAPRVELEEAVRSTGFYRNKARSIQEMAARLVASHEGEVPSNMPELLELQGVARKTANVVLGTAFGLNEGVVVDTHVGRVSGRLGLTRELDPVKIEQDLMALFPREKWTYLAHALIQHGRRVCQARKPACEVCMLNHHCAYYARKRPRA